MLGKIFLTHYRYKIIGLCIILIIVSTILSGCGDKTNEEEINEQPIIVEEGNKEEEESSEETAGKSELTEETEKVENSVTVLRKIYGTEIEITANPIQIKDGIAVLELEYRLTGDIDPIVNGNAINLYSILANGVQDLGPKNIRLIDFENKQAYDQLLAAKNPQIFITGEFTGVEEDYTGTPNNILNERRPLAKSITLYQAPENEKVTVFVSNFGLISDVPVEEAGDNFEAYIEIAGEPDINSKDKQSGAFREYLQDYGEEIVIKKEGIDVTITISSDVLFASAEYELGPEANEALNKAVENIKSSYDGGTIKIVGHTDDVDTEEYNQTLSEKRAEAVAVVMKQELGANFTLETLGKGETEPIVEGTSAEERAVNRRVDIIFEGKKQDETLIESEANTEIPKTEMPTSVGVGEWVEFIGGGGDQTSYKMRAVKIIRGKGTLVGYFELVYKLDENNRTIQNGIHEYDPLLKDGRGIHPLKQMRGAHYMSLLTSKGRMFPYDYGIAREGTNGEEYMQQRLLGDDWMYATFATGEGETPPLLVTVIWPDIGRDKVTVDVEDRFRIEDIEVEDNMEDINGDY